MEPLERLISQATTKTPERVKTAVELAAEKKAREEEEKEEEELEKKCEQYCSKICRIGIVVPMFFAYLVQPIAECLMRPAMVVHHDVDLSGVHAVVTGGCSGIGLRTAALLAECGAAVVLGCRDAGGAEAERALEAVRASSLRWARKHTEQVKLPSVLQLRLDRMASVRAFAEQYVNKVGQLELLVNNAGTRLACNTTDDGIEVAFQANYLGHFLLTKLLLPTLRHSSPARVVHVTCRDGYIRPAHGWNQWFRDGWVKGWLGWPSPVTEGIRVGPSMLEPKVQVPAAEDDGETGHAAIGDTDAWDEHFEDDEEGGQPRRPALLRAGPSVWPGGCKPERAYANAKLAVLSFSHELERRLRKSSDGEGIVSHAVNPNAVASEFANKKGSPASAPQQWSCYKVISYFPPVWIMRKFFGLIQSTMGRGMLRSVDHGAKAVFHIASSEALAGGGGGLFDDMESAFTNCGRPAHKCGRVPRSWEPPVVHDLPAARQLWELSEDLVRGFSAGLVRR